jgi:antagonist of KipI
MPLKILKCGIQDTIQDCGRFGFSHLGVSPGGMMDTFAGKMANVLVGNHADKALLEMHSPAAVLQFTEDALISITGADFIPEINGQTVPLWHPIVVRKHSILSFTGSRFGARCYLAVHGGLFVEKWLGSFSTDLRAGAGGRRPGREDMLQIGYGEMSFSTLLKPGSVFQSLRWSPDVKSVYEESDIFFTTGKEYELLDEGSVQTLETEAFIVSDESNRMGYRLQGPPLQTSAPVSMISVPVTFGTIQLLPQGQLVILMADHQTMGGYARIGHVISAHLPKLAQYPAHHALRFRRVEPAEAELLLTALSKELQNLESLCLDHLKELLWRK